MKKWTTLLSIWIISSAFLSAQSGSGDAASLVSASRGRISADTVFSQGRMVITGADGVATERGFDWYSKDGQNGARTVIVFQRPASVANTRYLVQETVGGANERWIFLPTIGRVRALGNADGGRSFMGTDFSYDDLAFAYRRVDLDTHRVINEENVAGNPCYVIESLPKDRSYQYSKMVLWIDKSNSVNRRAEFYDRDGTLAKRLEVRELDTVQGFVDPSNMVMTSVKANSSTAILVDTIKYNDSIPEGIFSTDYLATGKS